MHLTLFDPACAHARVIEAEEGSSLLDALVKAGAAVASPCGGAGTCGKCAVDVRSAGSGDSAWERVLSCQTPVREGLEVRLAASSAAAASGKLEVEQDAPLAFDAAAAFPRDAATPGDVGVAVDLGTTTVAAYLVDLTTGEVIAHDGEANPQAAFGADVISRIRAWSEGRGGDLQRAAADCIRGLAQRLCEKAGVDEARVARWSIAGNTVMEHIVCGISPESIGAFPFEPQTRFGEVRAVPGVTDAAYLAPCVSGYVGGDIVAGLVACGVDEALDESDTAPTLFADLGTNGEMALACKGSIACCATATGPAFEGANISQGMQACPGAVCACRFVEGNGACGFDLRTVDDAPAVGICGSGLIDALSACLSAGVVDETGRVLTGDEAPEGRASLTVERDGGAAVLLARDGSVALAQKDVRALQLAKAAVAAGISVMLEQADLDASDVSIFDIGGAFGAHMRPESAAHMGMIPRELLGAVRMVGNCAGAGAVAALLSAEARERMARVAREADYVELSLNAEFSDAYIDAMEFEEAIS